MKPRVMVLDEHTANRIAAGEVVERPAAAVKELVENAIDAGARRVHVEVEEGGRKLIRVVDDGWGMSREDALLALQRHATSKIREPADLDHIVTLGFRGEALPSIASVSRMQLDTREPEAETGVRLTVEAGVVQDLAEAGMPPGTRVTVQSLFYNTPARLKFTKSDATEFGHIADIVGRLALAHPGVAVRLTNNGRDVFSTTGSGDLLAAVGAVWGRDKLESLVPVALEAAEIEVQGLASRTDASRPNRGQQAFFVNRRPIVSRLLLHAVDDAYRTLLDPGRFPRVVLFLEIPPENVDINIHPSKAEVRFRRDGEVHQAVVKALRGALMQAQILPRTALPERPLPQVPATWRSPEQPSAFRGRTQGGGGLPGPSPTERSSAGAAGQALLPEVRLGVTVENIQPPAADPFGEPAPAAENLGGWRLLGQVQNTFIVGENDQGLVLIDQHVAHERVLHDRLNRQMESHQVDSQRLLLPVTVTLSKPEAEALASRLEELNALGFDIEPFGGASFLVRSVPAILSSGNPEGVVRDLAADFAAEEGGRSREERLDAILSMAACKGAIKAGQPLAPAEMRRVVQDLLATRNPYYCPHGRPVIVTLPTQELLKRFKRA